MLHAYIYNDLLKKIVNGEFKENERIPAEPELQSFYGVSRITVRKAIEDLQTDGYVEKIRGKGTVVKSKKLSLNLQKLDSFTNEFQGSGIETSATLVSFQELIPPQRVKNSLKLGNNETCYYIERVRKIFDLKVGLQRTYVTKNKGILLTADQFDEHASLYALIKQCGIKINHAVENIEVKYADHTITELLELDKNFALFYRERIAYDKEATAIEYSEMYYRSDEYKYMIQLQLEDQ
ncbi:GntR family transcriptional regulator [Isobaculum melis]|uniref:GntR family transcriptional regulator n=1 Tax=Isobaculum melis TaxID=142588 RepID=A0A1H9T1L3_9LACT|nr:GntR family transcriptional regulator [Isobaculum melis]SER91021.1 GntR family transcriptional regulator [Isobaculum melis]